MPGFLKRTKTTPPKPQSEDASQIVKVSMEALDEAIIRHRVMKTRTQLISEQTQDVDRLILDKQGS